MMEATLAVLILLSALFVIAQMADEKRSLAEGELESGWLRSTLAADTAQL